MYLIVRPACRMRVVLDRHVRYQRCLLQDITLVRNRVSGERYRLVSLRLVRRFD